MSMKVAAARTDWAEDDDEESPVTLPPPEVITNKDGTETHITYSIREDGKKVKTTRRIRKTVRQLVVNPRVAERRQWEKFGLEKGRPRGPQPDTTTVGENIIFVPSANFKAGAKEDDADKQKQLQKSLDGKKIKCRICNGEHFTSRCPFKDTMAPDGELGAGMGDEVRGATPEPVGGLGAGGSSYVPPHLRKGGAATAGDRMGSKYERDDLATLRVTNVSEFAEEQDLRDMFERWGRVTRVFLAKDRETGRAKGFAFVSYADRADAARAAEKMDGFGFGHLILRVEFAKKAT